MYSGKILSLLLVPSLFFLVGCDDLRKPINYANGVICHSSDSNTDIYLRRILAKLEKIETVISPPQDTWDLKKEIESDEADASFIILEMFAQINYLRSGDLVVGPWANIIPDFLLNKASKSFDNNTDRIVAYFTEKKNYTKEEAEDFRARLPNRTYDRDYSIIEAICTIHKYLGNIIKADKMRQLVKQKAYEVTDYHKLQWDVDSYCWSDEVSNIEKAAIDAVKAGQVTGYWSLYKMVCKGKN